VTPLKEMHRGLYGVLKEAYGLPSKIARDCYRNALAIVKSWLGNGARGRRPVIGSVAVWLTRGQSYCICGGHVEIADGIRLEIVSMDKRYEGYEYREARLVQHNDKILLHISVRIPKLKPYAPRDIVAVDVNERHIYYGNPQRIEGAETVVERALHWWKLAERLQHKYSRPRYETWLRRRGILNRIRRFRRKARNVVLDKARRDPREIVLAAKREQAAVAREDLTKLVNIKTAEGAQEAHRVDDIPTAGAVDRLAGG